MIHDGFISSALYFINSLNVQVKKGKTIKSPKIDIFDYLKNGVSINSNKKKNLKTLKHGDTFPSNMPNVDLMSSLEKDIAPWENKKKKKESTKEK